MTTYAEDIPFGGTIIAAALIPGRSDKSIVLVEADNKFVTYLYDDENKSYENGQYYSVSFGQARNDVKARAFQGFIERLAIQVDGFKEKLAYEAKHA